MVVVERLDGSDEFLVGGCLERAIEQTERLHPVLHLIHGPRRYLLRAATGPPPARHRVRASSVANR